MQEPEESYVVCEQNGDCQEPADVQVRVDRPVFLSDYEVLQLCREHALARARIMGNRGYRVHLTPIGQLALPLEF